MEKVEELKQELGANLDQGDDDDDDQEEKEEKEGGGKEQGEEKKTTSKKMKQEEVEKEEDQEGEQEEEEDDGDVEHVRGQPEFKNFEPPKVGPQEPSSPPKRVSKDQKVGKIWKD